MLERSYPRPTSSKSRRDYSLARRPADLLLIGDNEPRGDSYVAENNNVDHYRCSRLLSKQHFHSYRLRLRRYCMVHLKIDFTDHVILVWRNLNFRCVLRRS